MEWGNPFQELLHGKYQISPSSKHSLSFLSKCEKCQRIVKKWQNCQQKGTNCITILYKNVNKLSKKWQNCQQKGAKLYNCIVYKMAMTGMSQFPGREADYRFAALLSLWENEWGASRSTLSWGTSGRAWGYSHGHFFSGNRLKYVLTYKKPRLFINPDHQWFNEKSVCHASSREVGRAWRCTITGGPGSKLVRPLLLLSCSLHRLLILGHCVHCSRLLASSFNHRLLIFIPGGETCSW